MLYQDACENRSSDHIIPQQWPRTGRGPWGSLFKRFPQLQPRRLLYSHPAATAEAASAVYHRLEPPWADSRFTLHAPIQHQHLRWYLRFILPAHSDFSCGDFAISLLQYLAEVGPWGSSHRPQRTSVRSKPSSPRHMPVRF